MRLDFSLISDRYSHNIVDLTANKRKFSFLAEQSEHLVKILISKLIFPPSIYVLHDPAISDGP
jgi:hypothetical protein